MLEESGLAPSGHVVSEGVDLIELLDSSREKRSPPAPSLPPVANLRSATEDASEGNRTPRGRTGRREREKEREKEKERYKSDEEDDSVSPKKHNVGISVSSPSLTGKGKEDTSDSWSEGEIECIIDFGKNTEDLDKSEDKDTKSEGGHKAHLTKADSKKTSFLYINPLDAY